MEDSDEDIDEQQANIEAHLAALYDDEMRDDDDDDADYVPGGVMRSRARPGASLIVGDCDDESSTSEEEDDDEWAEEAEEDADQEAGRGRPRVVNRTDFLRAIVAGLAEHAPGLLRGSVGMCSTRQPERRRPPPPQQSPLEADIAARVNYDTAAESLRHPDELVSQSRRNRGKNGARVRNTAELLLQRESGRGGGSSSGGGFSSRQRAHVTAFHSLPMAPVQQVDAMESRVYTGRFSASGNVFVAAFQHERKVKIYEPGRDWKLRKDIHARNLRWTVTDTDISPTEQFLIYSSITPDVHLVNLAASGGVASEANVTDVHECLHFGTSGADDDDPFDRNGFGIWAVRWSADGREILAGTGDNSLYLYDVAEGKVLLRIEGHKEDVNAVAYADDSGNLLLSGSDDNLCKVWDRRTEDAARGIAAGSFVGHLEGITHIDSKRDGRHFISNGKDQAIKLWDLRKCHDAAAMAAGAARPTGLPRYQWDYRWMAYPADRRHLVHPRDCSIMTYRGHTVLQTLIRAYFSPAASTGQRYIYSGSADGSVHIWDLVSGARVSRLRYHEEIVRDCAWHPTDSMLVTTAFDGTVLRWETQRAWEPEKEGKGRRRHGIPGPGHDQLA